MEEKTVNKLIKNKLLLFIPKEEKVAIIISKGCCIKEISKLINLLNEKDKIVVFNNLFLYKAANSYNQEDLIALFQMLSYHDKINILKKLGEENQQKYLKHIKVSEGVRIINDGELSSSSRVYIVDNILPQKTRMSLFNFGYIFSDVVSLAIIKYLDEETLRKALKRRQGLVSQLIDDSYAIALSFLPNEEEKLSLLKKDNEYKVNLTEDQKISIIITTNDKERIKVIKDQKIAQIKKKEVVKSLGEEGRLYFLNNPEEMDTYFPYYKREFYDTLSQPLAKKVLFDLSHFKVEDRYIENLIKRLEPPEIIRIIYDKSYSDISINEYKIKYILASLPDEYKLELIKLNNKYNVTLTNEQMAELISNMKPQNIIKVLIKEKEHTFENKDVWKIIESLSKNEVLHFLNLKDPEVKEFVNKYKTSFSKCLGNKDKMDIIYNRSEYGIYLEDERKIKLLKTIDLRYYKELLEDNVFKYFSHPEEVIEKLISDKKEFQKLDLKIQEHIVMYLTKNDNSDTTMISLNILKYTENAKELLNKYDEFQNLLEQLNINIFDFIQYGINSNKYNWDTIILDIINNNKVKEFINIKEYFSKVYYNNQDDKKKNVENFLELLNAYNKYETLCKNLLLANKVLNEEEKQDINFLFKSNLKESPVNITEIKKIRNEQIKKYQEIAKKSYSSYILKDALLNLFFGKDECEIKIILQSTGYSDDLNILKFNNRNNKEYCKIIDHVILMTEFIERILNTNDIKGLKEALSKYTKEENLETTKKYINYCRRYEEFIRKIYEMDISISLTKIDKLDKSLTKTIKAKEIADKYGGIAYDLTESKYVLMAHVKSGRENIDNLLNGISDGNSNFICMSPVSHRGQHYYAYSDYSTVFAYDTIEEDSFICSSVDNLGSNSSLKYNTSEVPEFRRIQKGVLETSEASSHKNAEVLLYRDGQKPIGIIIPEGTVPNDTAIEYHKKYNLPFILTQEIDKTIENPKTEKIENEKIPLGEYEKLEIFKDIEIKENDEEERVIAIITDPHALYEPTMACLTDIKSKGITEIYSLGDNIGHGPSPKETLELLSEYNVKSILGNHELYIIEEDSMEIFKNHLIETGALERTTDMTNWIKQELTEEQLEEIRTYPDKYEIVLPNEKKITLIHTTDAYNKEGKYSEGVTLENSILTIKGHKHFKSESDNEYTLRAVGIGQTETDDGFATYAILTIIEDEYFIEICNVPYSRSNLLHTINESNMPTNAKSLIKSWVSKK